jgi:hypothetical protein
MHHDTHLEPHHITEVVPDNRPKQPYSPPLLIKLELTAIEGGVSNLQEADGNGFFGS